MISFYIMYNMIKLIFISIQYRGDSPENLENLILR